MRIQGVVECIAHAKMPNKVDAAFIASNAAFVKLFIDSIGDSDGDDLISFKDKRIELTSEGRPKITIDGKVRHLALIEDYVQGLHWQRTVQAYAETVRELEAQMVTAANGRVVSEDPAFTPGGATKVPGIYFTPPTDRVPSGRVFTEGDIALVKDTGAEVTDYYDCFTYEPFAPVMDHRKIHGYLVDTGAVVKFIGDTSLPGTDPNSKDRWGIIKQIMPMASTHAESLQVRVQEIQAPTIKYKIPAYYVFRGGKWTLLEDIQILNDHGMIGDYSYEWLAPLSVGNYYETGYVIWTPRNTNTDEYRHTEAWSDIRISMDMYRLKDVQDDRDYQMIDFSAIQPDYVETRAMTELPVVDGKVLQVPNPAFIHNKPLMGVNVFNPGTFDHAAYYAAYMVDGGDFSNLGKPNNFKPPVDGAFQNVIIKTWRGMVDDMPDRDMATAPQGAKDAFSHTLRYRWADVNERGELIYSDGEHIITVPLLHFDQNVMHTISKRDENNAHIVDLAWTDYTVEGKPELKTGSLKMEGDILTDINGNFYTTHTDLKSVDFVEVNDTDTTVSLPGVQDVFEQVLEHLNDARQILEDEITRATAEDQRLDQAIQAEETRATNAEAGLDTRVTALEGTTTTVTALEATVTALEATVTALEATVTNQANTIAALEATVTNQANTIAALEAKINDLGTRVTTLETSMPVTISLTDVDTIFFDNFGADVQISKDGAPLKTVVNKFIGNSNHMIADSPNPGDVTLLLPNPMTPRAFATQYLLADDPYFGKLNDIVEFDPNKYINLDDRVQTSQVILKFKHS